MTDKPNSPCCEEQIEESRREFLKTSSKVLGGVGAVCALTPFMAALLPSTKTKAAGAPVQVDLSDLLPGEMLTVEWRGKPVWILKRTEQMIDKVIGHDPILRDPTSNVDQQPAYAKNAYRSRSPEFLVLVGVCTHLGCTPKFVSLDNEFGPDWPGGFYCPCHGSKFDLAGRVFKGVPAPINLQVPPYYFVDNNTLVIGAHSETDAIDENS